MFVFLSKRQFPPDESQAAPGRNYPAASRGSRGKPQNNQGGTKHESITAALAFAGGHAATVSTMEIETDGDCDSAFVTTLGREYFVGANGYEVD